MKNEFLYQVSLWDDEPRKIELRDKKVAITGKLALPRQAAIDVLRECGAVYASSVSSRTDYLIRGEPRKRGKSKISRKLVAAEEIRKEGGKIIIISPVEFYSNSELFRNE